MTARGPTAIRIRDRQIYRSGLLFFPHCARHLLAVQQVMLDTGEDAAPVTAIHSLVNHSADFYINSVATQNPVVDTTEQIQQPALFLDRRNAIGFIGIAPCFRLVLRHAW
jgi:hypothetical protein